MTFQQLVDFKDESDALYDLLASLTDEEFQRNTQFKDWTIHDVIAHLHMFNWAAEESIRDGDSFTRFYQGLIQRRTNTLVLQELMRLSVEREASPEVRATASDSINAIDNWLSTRTSRESNSDWRALFVDSRLMIRRFRDHPAMLKHIPPVVVPPGSPIGTGITH